MSQRCQDANKSSGVCSVCQATRQLHHKDGKVHDKPCPGSNKLFLCASQQLGTGIQPQSSVSLPATQTGFQSSTMVDQLPSSVWSPANVPLIKHIPSLLARRALLIWPNCSATS